MQNIGLNPSNPLANCAHCDTNGRHAKPHVQLSWIRWHGHSFSVLDSWDGKDGHKEQWEGPGLEFWLSFSPGKLIQTSSTLSPKSFAKASGVLSTVTISLWMLVSPSLPTASGALAAAGAPPKLLPCAIPPNLNLDPMLGAILWLSALLKFWQDCCQP